ncbi:MULTISPECIES: Fe-S cluster assembly protein SufD [Halomonadaceae]|jgi:Fe-S cluster assembly protein SufD|uniref:Fe-S cluster assembly protein SufD n=2 Tax=Gammaproteobacteria TaxID=1236 RepID=A0A8H9I378_9GAMM|nr:MULTISPECIES: Fe-S cluster assembly protein SufD [Halomonas]ATH78471.1 Fe-S cluster assembly protein SufD [Halomonas hydrothermalis]KHJ50945.1 Fe-S cluster assembly protein SufD [Halomonas hydrothermalis]MDM7480949.1 Fe-S cluster assembly protein SufD [Halomonas sp.]NGO88296.1 Fe-S cluster assembly protein SufD [Halomonas sp.]PJX13645.1 Fe-S cluster assembly protein SufD [Halomonas sp. 141]
MSETQTFLDTLAARSQQRGAEPSWMAARRQAGAARFEAMGFPTRRDEEWKYTDVRAIAQGNFALADNAEFSQAQAAALTLPLEAYRLTFVDGVFSAALSDLEGLPSSVQVMPLSKALSDNHEAVGGPLGRLTGVEFSPFSALNTAFVEEGAVVRIAPGTVVEKPILLQFLSRAGAPVMSHPRVLVEAAGRSEATLIEHYVGEADAANFTNVVGELMLDRGAILNHYKLQEAPLGDLHIASIHVEQSRDSRYTSYNLNLGGALVRNDLICELDGQGAESNLYGLFFGQGRQHVDNHTKVNHNAPLTFSNENYKGILDDRAQGVFNGRVYVKRDSQKIEGFQSNQNLLLSDRAQINAKPELEIYADDVKCSHGTTTGQLDEEAVYALRTRGIDEATARGLLTLAFAGEVLEQVTLDAIAERVELAVAGKLPERFNLAGLVEAAAALND